MKKNILLILIGCLVSLGTLAQTKKTDQIVKLDNSVIEVIIDEVSEDEILYKLPNNPRGPIQKVKKAEVLKLIYASGTVEEINTLQPTAKADKIIRKDGRVIQGKIVSVSPGKVEYKSLDTNDLSVYMVSGADVTKLEYADGTTRELLEKNKKTKATPKKNVTFEQQVAQHSVVAKPRRLLDLPKFVFGIGVDGLYVLEPLSKQWVASGDSTGIQQGVGFSVNTDIHLTKGIALSLLTGYHQWQVQRNYTLKDLATQAKSTQYSTVDKFGIIPLQAGLKLYLAKGFYINPNASFNLITTTFTNKDGDIPNPNGVGATTSSLSKVGYGGNLGFEVYKLPFVIDFSARFQVVNAESFRNIGEPLYYAGLRLGIGFAVDK